MKEYSPQRRRLLVAGQVQGVGFRPFVYRLALRHGLTGSVGNTSDGVRIEVQGGVAALEAFARDFAATLPPLARVTRCRSEDVPPVAGEPDFRIAASTGRSGHSVLVSPDVATCAACEADICEPGGRRHRYPFTNCTNCGPRYTITRAIPYDRAVTSMACFPQCPACQAEYDNPLDRRFHAQPNACPVCGPHVWATTGEHGAEETGPEPAAYPVRTHGRGAHGAENAKSESALRRVAETLLAGGIAAVKGLGGFHLACDARNAAAVEELRRRKNRPHKPLAVMVRDLPAARRLAHLGAVEEALLCGSERPIVLCRKRHDALPSAIAPDSPTVGLVLAYTPLHMILLDICAELGAADPALVMTSGNAGGEPICLGNREALRRLAGVADIFLLHNRDILVRADDSVVMPCAAAPLLFYRRARGYVPRPVTLRGAGPCVLGAGPELKATLCLTRDDAAFVSQHVGDLQNLETLGFYEEVAAHLETLLEVRPEAVVCDLHPDFLSTRFAQELARQRGIELLRLQHHFAHGWSVLAEHGHEGPALVLALDGTGLGDDGTVWGGELLLLDTAAATQQRLGRLRPFALPGSEAAIREPWRSAQGLLTALGLEHDPALAASLGAEPAAAAAVAEMARRGIRCVPTSSAGRLFDAVAALLGVCGSTSYEGQAAIRLEAAQDGLAWGAGQGCGDGYAATLTEHAGLWELDTQGLFAAVADDVRRGAAVAVMARRFHVALAQGFAHMAGSAARAAGVRVVGLSGGVMQNATLAALLPHLLERQGLTPLLHRDIPANDGGVSLGQAAWGRRVLRG